MKSNSNNFNREERNGLFLLCFLIVLFSVFIFLQKAMIAKPVQIALDSVEVKSSTLAQEEPSSAKQESNISQSKDTKKEYQQSSKPIEKKAIKKLEVQKRDVPEPVQLGESREAFVQNEPEARQEKPKKGFFSKKKSSPVNLNEAHAGNWQKLRGIGPVLSERIVKYKDWLGGFYRKEQLKEVYGVTDSLFQTIEEFVLVDEHFNKININHVSVKDLASHPYMEWKDAKKIMNYKKHHGDYLQAVDFNKIIGLNEENLRKIMPYFEFKETSQDLASHESSEK